MTLVALENNVASIGVTLQSGGPALNLSPRVGSKMGVKGTQTNGGLFNVDPAVVTAVTYDASTGVGTVSFTLEGADVATSANWSFRALRPVTLWRRGQLPVRWR